MNPHPTRNLSSVLFKAVLRHYRSYLFAFWPDPKEGEVPLEGPSAKLLRLGTQDTQVKHPSIISSQHVHESRSNEAKLSVLPMISASSTELLSTKCRQSVPPSLVPMWSLPRPQGEAQHGQRRVWSRGRPIYSPALPGPCRQITAASS